MEDLTDYDDFDLGGPDLKLNQSIRAGLVCNEGFNKKELSILTSLYMTCKSLRLLPDFHFVGLVQNAPTPPGFTQAFGDSIPVYPDFQTLVKEAEGLELILFAGEDSKAVLPCLKGIRCLPLDAVESFLQLLISKMSANGAFQQTELIFASIIDQISEEFLILSPDGIVKNINKALLNRLGGNKADYIGKHCRNLEGPDFCSTAALGPCPFEECVSSGHRIERHMSYFTSGGEARYYRVNVTPIFNTRGRMVRIFMMRRDITDQVLLEQQSRVAERLSTEMTLLHQITHEVRNPLFVIGGFAGALLRTQNIDGSIRNKAQAILDESKRLDELLMRLSDALKPISPKLGVININEELHTLLEHYRGKGLGEKVVFKEDLNQGLPNGRGDAELFRQCMSQLLDNSIASMPEGGSVTIRSRHIDSLVKVQVADTGKGISPEEIGQLFNPLLRPKKEGGGLIRVKKAIEEMGGGIDVQSLVNRGTTITLSLAPVMAGQKINSEQAIPQKH